VVVPGDTVEVRVVVEKADYPVRIFVKIEAPGLKVLVENQSKLLDTAKAGSKYDELSLSLKAIDVGEYVAVVKLYKIENSSLIEVDRRNVLIKAVEKAKLTVRMISLIFGQPITETELIWINLHYRLPVISVEAKLKENNYYFPLQRVGDRYETYLPKAVYDIQIVGRKLTIATVVLDNDKEVTLKFLTDSELSLLSWIPSILVFVIAIDPIREFIGRLLIAIKDSFGATIDWLRKREYIRTKNEWKVLNLARYYVALTPEVVAYKLRIPMKKVLKILGMFVKYGSAKRRRMGNLNVYVFSGVMPSSPLVRQIIEVLLKNPRGMTFPELLGVFLGVAGPVELMAALEELKSQGVVVESGGVYRLRGLSPVRSGEG